MIELEAAPAEKKIKVLVLSDHPMSPSGVGTQTRYVVESLLRTGKFSFICLGGAVKHQNYDPVRTEEFGEDLVIYPVDGYGTQDMVRSVIHQEKPDIMWIMTDPRFWGWLWEIENEIRQFLPIVYYHVWDNYPYPHFNKPYYESNDAIASISKLTDDIVRTVAPEVKCKYIPHAVDETFTKLSPEEILGFKKNNLQKICNWEDEEKFIFFWNNRNARRKMSGSVLWWFKEFLDEVGHDKASLIMHTDPKDAHGQDLEAMSNHLGLNNGEVIISADKVPPKILSYLYNVADCTVNISDAEGFGLATLESLSCETPIIVTMTGGLQFQVTDKEEWFGIGIEPSSKAVIGSQGVPWIFEDRVNKEDFINALKKMYNMTKEERSALGKKGREYVDRDFSFGEFKDNWINFMLEVHEEFGSWDTRKKYKSWDLTEV